MPDALEVRGLDVHYGKATALQSVALRVEEGTLVAVVGNNGAGKTSLLHAVMGLVHPSAGTVRLFDRDVTGLPTDRLVSLGAALVPEGRHVFADQTVLENLRLGWARRPNGAAFEERLATVFDLFPALREHAARAAGMLSGGQQQMLAIGRALAAAPRLLLLDEPSLGLAPLVAESVFSALRSLVERGITVVVAEASPRRALAFCDRAYVFGLGVVRAEGSPKDLEAGGALHSAYLGT
ncbi:MAG TPA: ABC transporter ATP-binding protein [Candidatus Dormibacteraeota bacterium]|nr:ABC transporter ATP-binding protein [Candidatus Dormibacteraeota bacterium]